MGSSPFNNASQDTGAVYVFRRSGATWQQEIYIKAATHNPSDQFGNGVAISGDTLAVTAYFEDSAATGVGGSQPDNSSLQSGAAYVFRRSGVLWQQAAFLKASNTGTDDNFGNSVAISGDTIAVGAQVEDSSATGVGGAQGDNAAMDSGAVYIFH